LIRRLGGWRAVKSMRSLGMTSVAVSKWLRISQPAVTRAAYRGEAIAAANNLELLER
jgi:hypothetical protein